MKKIYFLFLINALFYAFDCHSQITFVEGYYINNSDQKIDGLIKNVDWKNNPTEFEYKTSDQGETETLTIESVKEFGIGNVSKYIRFDVDIDRSSYKQKKMSDEKDPIFEKETLFLKVLIEGEASLFTYKDKSLTRYFYQTKSLDINQLIFKKYKIPTNKIATNNEFRRQLYNNLKCPAISMDDFEYMAYEKKALLKLFTKYNSCNNSEFVNFENKATKNLFNLNIRPGLNSSSLAINTNNFSSQNTDYGNELALRIGLEFEFIMGFNNNKWAVIIEPTYQYFEGEAKTSVNFSNTNVNYSSIELPVGIRHYLFLNNKSKLFINGSVIYDLVLDSEIRNLEANSSVNLGFGLGYNYNNRYSVEFRYQTNRDFLTDYVSLTSEYQTLSIIFGYTLL